MNDDLHVTPFRDPKVQDAADQADPSQEPQDDELLALDEALHKLSARDPVKAELVRLRYFGGLSTEQAAQTLDISTATAER